jgi:hypothetical protein
MVGLLFVDEAGRLLVVDTFKKLPMKKHILHVQLVHRPVVRGGEVKDCPNHGGFDDRGECLIEVDPRSLVEAVDDPSCLRRAREPSGRSLFLNTHLPVITRVPGGRGTRAHVWLACRASNSARMASRHSGS